MLKFHVDLHTNDPQDVKFHTIVDAETAEGAKLLAEAVMQQEKPNLEVKPHWEWSIYEFPLG